MSLLSTPTAAEWSRMRTDRQREWIQPLFDARVGITGGNLSALVAGCVLQLESIDTVLIVTSEQLGGRLTWRTGPVGIASPAHRVLVDLGWELDSDPPVFIDRHRLLHNMAHKYLASGGFVLSEVTELSEPVLLGKTVEISCEWSEDSLVLEYDDLIGTVPVSRPDAPSRTPNSDEEHMVLGTGRRRDGWVQAGRQALTPRMLESEKPLESSLLLSGRKAAEVVLDKLG